MGEETLSGVGFVRAHYYLEESLCEAARMNDLSRARRILMERVDPNWINGFGLSPLHIASRYGNFEIVKILVCNKASVDLENAIGVTPLHLAAKNNHLKCAQLLLLSGAAASKPTRSLCTPREYAPSGSKLRKVLELAEQGIYPDPARVFEMSVEPLVPKFSIPSKSPEREQKNSTLSKDTAAVSKKKRQRS